MDVNSILIFRHFPLITCLLSPFSGGLIKMAYCAERDEEFHVSTMFEYYKAPFTELFVATFFSYLTNTVIGGTKLHQIPILDVVVSITRIIYHYDDSAHYFLKTKSLEAIQASVLIVSKQPLVFRATCGRIYW
jgi:hypothetical protein